MQCFRTSVFMLYQYFMSKMRESEDQAMFSNLSLSSRCMGRHTGSHSVLREFQQKLWFVSCVHIRLPGNKASEGFEECSDVSWSLPQTLKDTYCIGFRLKDCDWSHTELHE